jgi:glyoxylase-like metal-dependent hydrolase (beta-lactamase superfamily II)
MHRFHVGELECFALSDGGIPVPRPPVQSADASASTGPQGPFGFTLLPLSSLLVRLPGVGIVLVDTGFGPNATMAGQPIPTVGRLPASLAAAGFAPEEVNAVLISHMHPDHIGGLYGQNGEKLYPNASYHVPAEEFTFWSQDPLDISFTNAPPPLQAQVTGAAKHAVKFGRDEFKIFSAGEEVVPGVRSILLPGHSPGQVGFILSSGAETLLFTADSVTNPIVSVETPDVRNPVDMNPSMAAETRHKVISLLLQKGWMSLTTHFPWPSIGRVTSKDGQTIWEPVV